VGVVLSTIIVVPCFNEAARLQGHAFTCFLAGEPNVRFLFVDDGSTDASAEVINLIAREWPERVQLLRLDRNAGKAEAVRQGVLEASRSPAVLIGYWDADLATPLSEIPAMAGLFADVGISFVIGSRIRMLGRDIHRSALRHYVGRAFATFASIQLGLPVYDTQCGAKIFRASPEILDLFSRPFRLRWCFDVELLGRFTALDAGYRLGSCVEFPVTRWIDVGASKLTMGQALRVLPELVRLPAILDQERRRHAARAPGAVAR
jgi:glycosyltransferase involved in cell wall biosynthesis